MYVPKRSTSPNGPNGHDQTVMNYEGVFDQVLDKYCVSYALEKVSSIDLGTLFELVYSVEVKNDISEKEMLDELRCKNGNLNISLIMAPKQKD